MRKAKVRKKLKILTELSSGVKTFIQELIFSINRPESLVGYFPRINFSGTK